MSVLLSRVDVTRTRLSARTSPDAGPAPGAVRLTTQKTRGVHQRSSGYAKRGRKAHRGAVCRTLAGSERGECDVTPMDFYGRDLLTSHFEEGSRGVVLAALKQRSLSSHSAPKKREVKVQLLDPQQSSNSNSSLNAAGAHKRAQLLSANPGEDFSRSKEGCMVVGACQQVDNIDREGWARGRGLSRMEVLHNHQLELQNQLLQSALSIVTRYTPSDPSSPANQQVDPTAAIINPSVKTSVETDLVTMATHTDHTREERCAKVVSVATHSNDSLAALANEAAGSVRVESEPVMASMLEEARQLLQQLRWRKKVLDENLESVERERGGEVLHCQLKALVANSESSEQARIKKTVDAWIHLIGKNIQPKIQEEAPNSRSVVPLPGRPVNALTGTGSKRTATGRGLRCQQAAPRRAPPSDESYLTRLYGRAPRAVPTPGLQRSPSLHLNSMGPPTQRKPRLPAVDGAKGQTCWRPQTRQSTRLTSAPPTKAPSAPMAIPLAHPRIGPSPRCHNTVTSLPVEYTAPELPSPACPTPDSPALLHATPDPPALEHHATPDLPVLDPPSLLSSGPLEECEELGVQLGNAPVEGPDVKQDSPLHQERVESVEVEAHPTPSVTVETEAVVMEECPVGEEVLHLDSGPSPLPVAYQGPVFPPENCSAIPPHHCSCAATLEDGMLNQMVLWLEQQLMARILSEHYPPPLPAHDHNDRSEAAQPSVTSDIVEAAGGGGLQFFVDAGIPVDSPLVKELVHKVLAEMVEQVLAPREAPVPGPAQKPRQNPGAGLVSSFQKKSVPEVPAVVTPLPTPLASPVPSIREQLPLSTPPASEPIDRSPPPVIAAPPEPVATPIPSPEILLAVHQGPNAPSSGAANPLSDKEEEHPDVRLQSLQEQENQEEEETLPSAPARVTCPVAPPPADPDPPLDPSDDTTASAASDTDSSTVTGSDSGLKLLSEGELLISFHRLDSTTTEEASSSSSLQDVEEDLSSGEVTHSITPELDGKVNHSGDAMLEATNESNDVDPTPVASRTLTSDLQSEPAQVIPLRRSSPPSVIGTCVFVMTTRWQQDAVCCAARHYHGDIATMTSFVQANCKSAPGPREDDALVSRR
ncbi:protein TALPID3 isoform X3 [Syngnathus typhle]|uniref:protein TALPID3 isoform X3 n=1 Tax=Syngnathus typhle TaxID=161592 RepID=UPI002A6A2C5B|nr:protein TALPID3 isoform X3 [Syngnathus typhle]